VEEEWKPIDQGTWTVAADAEITPACCAATDGDAGAPTGGSGDLLQLASGNQTVIFTRPRFAFA
jgi:hypothetical protein